MFSHEGPSRSARKNAVLAGYLALNAGFVNSGGFVLIGSFTSHVTGSIGRLGNDLATRDVNAGLFAALLVASFFVGAFVASVIIESKFRAIYHAYGTVLLLEGLTLAVFVLVAGLARTTHPRGLDAEAALLCLAMGMQNSLVTRLSGTVVRTTHLTGVITDLGVESARWYLWNRAKLSRIPTLLPIRELTRPLVMRTILLATITVAFTVGAVCGAFLTFRLSRWSMLVPAFAVLSASLYAFLTPVRSSSPGDTT